MKRQKPAKRPKSAASQPYPVPALEKGLDVLELLSQARKALGLNEIAVALDRSRQELFRVVTRLAARGYLLRDVAGNYRLSSQMLEVGSRHVAHQALVVQALPAMEQLAETTGESCQLSLVGRERLLVVTGAVGSAYLQLEVKVGNSIPLYNSVIGMVALAWLSEPDRQAAWNRRKELAARGDDVFAPEIRGFAEWRKRLATVRRNGYTVAASPAHIGSRVHAGALLNASGTLAGVLSIARLVAVREPRRRDAEISNTLLACCREISARLGAGDEPDLPAAPNPLARRR